jgi:hypothetical protein
VCIVSAQDFLSFGTGTSGIPGELMVYPKPQAPNAAWKRPFQGTFHSLIKMTRRNRETLQIVGFL